jgi:hypothetical protein
VIYNCSWLTSQAIGDGGLQFLAEALKTNKTLVALSIGNCSLTDESGRYIAGFLERNSTLKQLGLASNSFTDEGEIIRRIV